MSNFIDVGDPNIISFRFKIIHALGLNPRTVYKLVKVSDSSLPYEVTPSKYCSHLADSNDQRKRGERLLRGDFNDSFIELKNNKVILKYLPRETPTIDALLFNLTFYISQCYSELEFNTFKIFIVRYSQSMKRVLQTDITTHTQQERIAEAFKFSPEKRFYGIKPHCLIEVDTDPHSDDIRSHTAIYIKDVQGRNYLELPKLFTANRFRSFHSHGSQRIEIPVPEDKEDALVYELSAGDQIHKADFINLLDRLKLAVLALIQIESNCGIDYRGCIIV